MHAWGIQNFMGTKCCSVAAVSHSCPAHCPIIHINSLPKWLHSQGMHLWFRELLLAEWSMSGVDRRRYLCLPWITTVTSYSNPPINPRHTPPSLSPTHNSMPFFSQGPCSFGHTASSSLVSVFAWHHLLTCGLSTADPPAVSHYYVRLHTHENVSFQNVTSIKEIQSDITSCHLYTI